MDSLTQRPEAPLPISIAARIHMMEGSYAL